MGVITDPPGHPGYGASIDNRGVAGHEFSDHARQIAALQSQVDALRTGLDEALFALYLDQPAAARVLRQKYLPEPSATGEQHE